MKNRIKLNESTLKQIIAESISRVLSESKVYTMDDLRRHRRFQVGQIVDDEVIEDLANDKYIEPRVWDGTVLQLGEPYDETGYQTFMVTKDGWVYVGTRG